MSNKPPVVLVHGAWHGSWCWQPVAELLVMAGREVFAPDLPGHGNNQLPANKVTYKKYCDTISSLIREINTPVLLAGHSMAGMIISSVASSLATEDSTIRLIDRLLYINAYIPCDGDSVFSLAEQLDKESLISNAMVLSSDKRSYSLGGASFRRLFLNETRESIHSEIISKLQPQASLPLNTKVSLDQAMFSKIRKTAICSSQDRVIPLPVQYGMLSRQTCDEFIQINGDHSLFYSAPEDLSRLIDSQ